MGWLSSLDRDKHQQDRAFFLEAWDGHKPFVVDRIGRGTLHVPALCLSIFGGIQPGPLKRYVTDALTESEKADGLLQRFQVTVWPDLRQYSRVDRWPDTDARGRAQEAFAGLAEFDAEKFGATQEEGDEVPYVRFDGEAQGIFDSWRDEFEPRFRAGDYPPQLRAIS